MQRATIVWVILILLAGTTLIHLKFQVQALEKELAQLDRDLLAGREALHVLKAEWTYLTRPERLEALNRNYLGLQPVAPDQIVGPDEIPRRHTPAVLSGGAWLGPRIKGDLQ